MRPFWPKPSVRDPLTIGRNRCEPIIRPEDGSDSYGSVVPLRLRGQQSLTYPPPPLDCEGRPTGLPLTSGFAECNIGFRQELTLSAANSSDCSQSGAVPRLLFAQRPSMAGSVNSQQSLRSPGCASTASGERCERVLPASCSRPRAAALQCSQMTSVSRRH